MLDWLKMYLIISNSPVYKQHLSISFSDSLTGCFSCFNVRFLCLSSEAHRLSEVIEENPTEQPVNQRVNDPL